MNKLNFKAMLFFTLAGGVLLAVGNSQAQPGVVQQDHNHGQHRAQASDKWAEMEAFHGVMSQTFHPAEEGKLEPIRKRAGEMATKAKQWLDSKPPKVYDSADIKALLVKLNAESKAMADSIAKGASDEQVKKDLTARTTAFTRSSAPAATKRRNTNNLTKER